MQLKKKVILLGSLVALASGSFVFGLTGLVAGNKSDQALAESINSEKVASNHAAGLLSLGANTIADMAQKVAPAVVNIEVDQKIASQPMNMPQFNFPFGNVPGGMEFFYNGKKVTPGPNGKIVPPSIQRHNAGSGFIVRPDGYIITNAHVVRGASKIKVTLTDRRSFDGKVVGIDGFSDLAVVKIDANNLPTVPMGSSTTLRPGEFAVAIGNPLGFDHTVTLGIISAVERTVTDVNGNINFIQTDAAINPGNSGGPLLNLAGEVIGVNTAIQANAQNIGFSIPVDIAKAVSEQLIAHKQIDRPWLGIAMAPIDDTMAKSLGLSVGTKGVLVAQVLDGSPAQAAGLERGDVIQKIDGKDITAPDQLRDCVRAHKVSEKLNLFVLRNNQVKAVAVSIGTFPNETAKADNQPEQSSDDPSTN